LHTYALSSNIVAYTSIGPYGAPIQTDTVEEVQQQFTKRLSGLRHFYFNSF